MVWLLTCDGESACVGRLINGGNTMIFLGMFDGSNTMLLLAGADGLIDGREWRHGASSLGWSTVQLVTCNGESACMGGLINGGNMMLFHGKIDGSDTTLLHLAG